MCLTTFYGCLSWRFQAVFHVFISFECQSSESNWDPARFRDVFTFFTATQTFSTIPSMLSYFALSYFFFLAFGLLYPNNSFVGLEVISDS